ncbi:MAG TPA: HEAT repeat domain-containing protein, partial [Candidatus Ozemobacteraceae bacterium]|nr:HEAT repeat domain-containing protein [Candidatus Ozemobacteraceae bacterium]
RKPAAQRELVPVLTWIRPKTSAEDCAMPIPGVPGEFTADQILGLVKRLWDNRESARPEVRQQVEEFLPRVVPSLMKVAESDLIPESVRYDAVLLLGNVRTEEALPLLNRLVTDKLPAVRYASVTALAGYAPDEAVTPLLTALRDKHSLVRASAAQALGKLRPSPALPALVKRMADTSRRVRLSAGDAIRQYPGEELATRLPFILPRASEAAMRRTLNLCARLEDGLRHEVLRDLLKSRHAGILSHAVRVAMKAADPHLADELADAARYLEQLVPPAPPVVAENTARKPKSATSSRQKPNADLPRETGASVSMQTSEAGRSPASTLPSFDEVLPPVISHDESGSSTIAKTSIESVTPDCVRVVEPTPVSRSCFDMLSYQETFKCLTAFEQVRELRNLLEQQPLALEDLTKLYAGAAGAFVRSFVIDALKVHGPKAEPFLLLSLKEPEEETVLAAIKTLADVGSDLALDSLAMLKRHASQHVRFTTEIAIEKIRSRKGKA